MKYLLFILLASLLVPALTKAQLGKTMTKTDKEMYDARTKEADRKRKEAEAEKAREKYNNAPKVEVTSRPTTDEPSRPVIPTKPVKPLVFGYNFVDDERDNNGLYFARKDGYWGYLNQAGAEAICVCYEEAYHYMDSLYAVRKKGLWGFVNSENKVVIPCIYNNIGNKMEAHGMLITVTKDGRTFDIDRTGKEIFDPLHPSLTYRPLALFTVSFRSDPNSIWVNSCVTNNDGEATITITAASNYIFSVYPLNGKASVQNLQLKLIPAAPYSLVQTNLTNYYGEVRSDYLKTGVYKLSLATSEPLSH